MPKILLRIFPQQSHHNATYKISNALQAKGHTVTYAATSNLRASIEANGFMFYEITEKDDLAQLPVPKQLNKTLLNAIKVYFGGFRYFKYCKARMAENDFFSKEIKEINPDLILIDGAFKFFSFQLIQHKIPYLFIETTVSTKKYKNIPPLSSSFIPKDKSRVSRWLCSLQWAVYHNPLKPSFKKAFSEYCKKINYTVSDIDFNRYFLPGFKSIPEINTSLPQFDYPHEADFNHFYVSPVALEIRKEIACDWTYKEIITAVLKENKKIIFCSFGTMAWRYVNHEKFLRKLVKVFKKRTDCILIICVENDSLRRELLKEKQNHIHVFRRVPQIDLLKSVDVMINHGGLNSITECILSGVPMLVCPGDKYLDQYGNAGRVKYHKIGLQGSFNDSKKVISKKLNLLINNPAFKASILNLKDAVQRHDTSTKGIEFMELMMKQRLT